VSAPEITLATPADRGRIVESLVAAFPADPVLRFLFPDDYPRHAAAFFGHLFDKRVHRGTVWTIDGGAATAIWEPPADSHTALTGSDTSAPGGHTPPSGSDMSAPGSHMPPSGNADPLSGGAVPASGGGVPAPEIDLPADALARMREYDDAVHAALPTEPYCISVCSAPIRPVPAAGGGAR
jgi:hypothetical protein